MKRKLLSHKSVSSLKSLHKNLLQQYDGKMKQIKKKEKELDKISDDMYKVEQLIVKKELQ